MNSYDSTLFAGTAEYYAKYRDNYSPKAYDFVAEYFQLDRNGSLLDLGAGTGMVAENLRPYFQLVDLVDPDSEMLRQAHKQPALSKEGVQFIEATAETVKPPHIPYRLVTFGRSLHWMDTKVLESAFGWLDEQGGVAILANLGASWWYKNDVPWKRAVIKVVKKYLGEERRAGVGTFKRQGGVGTFKKEGGSFEDALAESEFQKFEKKTFEQVFEWDVERVVGHLYSTSFAARRLFGNRSKDFERDVASTLLEINPNGSFKETMHTEVIVARKLNPKKK